MPTPPKNKTSKAAKIVLAVGIALIIVMATALLFWESSPTPSRPKSPAAPIVPAAQGETAVQDNPAKAAETPPEISLESTDTLKQLTELQSALEVQKLMVALEEQNAKLKKLQEEPLPEALPQIVALPTSASAPVETSPAQSSPITAQERVISIQGLDNNIAATVETALGQRVLRVGDRYGEGTVERISVAGVQIREGESTHTISVEE